MNIIIGKIWAYINCKYEVMEMMEDWKNNSVELFFQNNGINYYLW